MNKKFFCLILLSVILLLFRQIYSPPNQDEKKLRQKETLMKEEISEYPKYLYKIVAPLQWEESMSRNYVINGDIDKDFIHLAKDEEQITHVIQKFWHGKDHIILKLNVEKFIGQLIYETNPGGSGSQYYHLYEGKIPLDAVEEISTIKINT